ncbi:MAG: hypothetical protein KJ958_05450 [Gammaproteobacteria bacterium]|nr:hypothetical protein [Gammaproteobacteria bacterium]MBU1978599.1 hypothetical protein [Gammaproteobacteria bacterium]
MSDRTAIQAAIKRATKAAQTGMNSLDAAALSELEQVYQQAAADIQAQIQAHAGGDGKLALSELQSLRDQVGFRLSKLSETRNVLLQQKLGEASALGVDPFTVQIPPSPPFAKGGIYGDGLLSASAAMQINNEALQFVRTFVAADGLQLSDRIWRIDRHAREAVTGSLEQAIIQGHGASQAARDFLMRGEAVPLDIQNKMGMANAGKVGKEAAGALFAGNGSPLDNAMRLFRTEINRAHGTAYLKGAEAHPDCVGTRFLISPSHPQHDICDLHASANLHGLGPGVYPPGKTPWPAHPNTLSYVVAVFKDEVTAADKAGKENAMQALDRLTPAQRIGVLGVNKHEVFKEGKLTQGMIKAPWKAVQKRIGIKPPVKPVPIPKPVKTVAPANLSLGEMISAGASIGDGFLKVAQTSSGINGPRLFEEIHKQLGALRPINTPTKVVNSGKGAEWVKAASRIFPDDWTKLADAYGPLSVRATTGRGRQSSLNHDVKGERYRMAGFGVITSKGGDGFISTGSFSTSVHEYTHRLQHVIPELDDYFQNLHARRTASDPLKRLRDLFPGYNYRRDEVAREDKYVSAYQGKVYSGYGHSYLGKHGALEVMTMAFEDVLGGSAVRLEKIVEHDREMFNLVIGLLFKYVP